MKPLTLLLALCVLWPSPASAYTIYTREALVQSFFPAAEVEVLSYTPPPEIADRLGYAPPQATYEIWVGRVHGEPVAYAILDAQLGQHEPISYAVLFDPRGSVLRVEITEYREAYGDGVKGEGFRRQFVGKNKDSSLKLGRDIQIVSGATISSRAITVGVRRDTILMHHYLGLP